MRAYSQKRRLFERYENVQNIQRGQTGGNVLRASSTGDNILGGHPRASAKTLLHIVDRRQIHDVEVAGPLTSLGQREGEYEEVILCLKDMIGLPNGCNAAAVLETLLKLSDIHETPAASVYRESIFDLAAAEHHSLIHRRVR
jgi:hypothetical protein